MENSDVISLKLRLENFFNNSGLMGGRDLIEFFFFVKMPRLKFRGQ